MVVPMGLEMWVGEAAGGWEKQGVGSNMAWEKPVGVPMDLEM